MICKQCNHKMIKVSDFTYSEVISFLDGERDFYALVLIEKTRDLWDTIEIKKSLNFRKKEEIEGNRVKLYGLKSPLIDGRVEVSKASSKIEYSLQDITPLVVKEIRDYMNNIEETDYSNTKLNNYLWKKSALKSLCMVEKIAVEIEEVNSSEDEEFPF